MGRLVARTTILSLAAFLVLAGPAGAVETVPAHELERGDTLIGYTTLSPDGVRSFDLVVAGVVEATAPGRDLIVAEALDPAIQDVGIFQGMSGSPVYLDGRLVGAVAAAWAFAKRPMAAVTPIDDMLELTSGRVDGSRAEVEPFAPLDLLPESERANSRAALLARRAEMPSRGSAAPRRVLGSYRGHDITALHVPVSVPGSPGFRSAITPSLERLGLTPVAATGGAASGGDEVVPGSPIGVQLVGGDYRLSATGTVTHRDGDTLVAFGHPLFGAGPTAMPLVAATVLDVVPLRSVSFRLTQTGDVVGNVVMDGATGIAGELGASAPTIPVRLALSGPGFDEAYGLDVVAVRPYSFLFASLAAGSAVSETYRTSGRTSVRLDVQIETDRESISYRDVFDTGEPAVRLGGELATLLNVLGDSRLAERSIRSVDIAADFTEGWGWYLIERVRAERAVVEPGDDVVLHVVLKPWRGEPVTRELRLPVPASASEGELLVRVGGASEYHEWDAERLGAGAAPRTYERLVELVESSKPGSTLVGQALSGRRSLSLAGREVHPVPGRAALAMGGGGAGGPADAAEMSVVSETELSMDREVTGFHELVVRVKSGPSGE
ncbi:MAG: hypothetical protein GF405_09185 [Candidatus Eisenbacteria bacterium]|nr:hypothetical protein [Candidatus Eisenbacteria bacterium]